MSIQSFIRIRQVLIIVSSLAVLGIVGMLVSRAMQPRPTLFQDFFLQQALFEANTECEKQYPDSLILEDISKEFIQQLVQESFKSGIIVYTPTMSFSVVKTITMIFENTFPKYKFQECLKTDDFLQSESVLKFYTEAQDVGQVKVYDYELVDVNIAEAFHMNKLCFLVVMDALTSKADVCAKKNINLRTYLLKIAQQ